MDASRFDGLGRAALRWAVAAYVVAMVGFAQAAVVADPGGGEGARIAGLRGR